MNVLGIRVEPKQVRFVVIQFHEKECEIINNELIKIPVALDVPERLKYVRNCVLDILREYLVKFAGIRVSESNAPKLNVPRLHMEGVIQEAFSSSEVKQYFTGRKQSISSKLGMTTQELTEIINGKAEYNELKNWGELSNPYAREAALVAMGASK